MNPNAILSEDLVALGLYIEEDDHFVYLKHEGEVIAHWWAPAARLRSIRNAARTWAKKHEKESRTMKAKCHYCKIYDLNEDRFLYHLANMTDWRPQPGYDPLLRQFKCPHCKKIFYELITYAERELEEAPC